MTTLITCIKKLPLTSLNFFNFIFLLSSKTIYSGDLNSKHLNNEPSLVWYSNGGLNTGPIGDRTTFDHFNTWLVWYSDTHSISQAPLNDQFRTTWTSLQLWRPPTLTRSRSAPHFEVPYPTTNGDNIIRRACGSCPFQPLHLYPRLMFNKDDHFLHHICILIFRECETLKTWP